jgi:replicative DNA helicase
MAAKREIIRRAADLTHHAYNGCRLAELTVKAAALTEELRSRVAEATPTLALEPVGAVAERVVAELRGGPRVMLRTPFPTLNMLLSGGFLPGELIYLGARPAVGKTALGLILAREAAEQGHPALVLSREMPLLALGRRVLAQVAGISATGLRAAELDGLEWERVVAALPRLHGLPVWFSDRPATVEQIDGLIRAAVARHAVRLVVVDYLQLIQAPRGVTDRRLAVEAASRMLKTLAIELELVVLCLSSLSRPERGSSRRPTLADLRESGALEHDADVVLLLHREEKEDPADTAGRAAVARLRAKALGHPEPEAPVTELLVAKGRDVATGRVDLLFTGRTLTFREQTRRVAPGA